MAADRSSHVILMGLEVTDHVSYARYRERMTPILEFHGGSFGCDLVVAKVLKGPSALEPRLHDVVPGPRRARSSSPRSTGNVETAWQGAAC